MHVRNRFRRSRRAEPRRSAPKALSDWFAWISTADSAAYLPTSREIGSAHSFVGPVPLGCLNDVRRVLRKVVNRKEPGCLLPARGGRVFAPSFTRYLSRWLPVFLLRAARRSRVSRFPRSSQ